MLSCEHPEKPAVARCVACGKRLCYECKVVKKGRNFCWDCAPGRPSGYRSPTFSMILSLLPGLGQVYAGSFLKGLAFLFGTGVAAAASIHAPAILILGYWFLGMWDARMTANKRNFSISNGRLGKEGVSEGDWMLIFGTSGLAALYLGLPYFSNVIMKPWALWSAFAVVFVLSTLLGRGGKNVKKA